jgi:hypothetical protein
MYRILACASSHLLVALTLLLAAAGVRAQVVVVNMIPQSQSHETNQDSEPNLAVNPANLLQIAGTAFTPDPGSTNAPIFTSTDGGNTWSLRSVVPGGNTATGTGDITVRFAGSSNILYAGTLRGDSFLRLNILRTTDFTSATPMTILVDRTSEDQPYVQASTVLGGLGSGNDRVYIGNNDLSQSGTTGRTAAIDLSLDASHAMPPPPAGFSTIHINPRGTGTAGQDGPPIRPAVHPDGTVYGIHYHWTAFTGSAATADVVVVRDDNWGTGTTPFTALTDPVPPMGDGLAGFRVVQSRTIPWANSNQPTFGQERFVGSNITLAVDPRDSSRVYIAWADRVGTTDYTLHVRRSETRGTSWTGDLLTITNATNPALAINSHGKVGFLYQQLTGSGTSQRWETHFRRTLDGVTWDDLTLARPLVGTPTRPYGPYLGDYIHVQAVGQDFYGIFSAENRPDLANFPQGVTYQRNHDFTTNKLLDLDNVTEVATSIDPFFFKVTEVPAAADFYVRDWTDSATSGDNGQEPSTHAVFYETSDVWNRQSNAPGAFNANDQPVNEDPQNGVGPLGNNFAFARIRRNAPGTAPVDVTLHFLYSEFGTGSAYQDLGSATLTFNPADHVLVATGQPWHLGPTTSHHLCLAVEISAPGDPLLLPSLLGNTPGWPSTDLMVINDNNKAQRNMGVYYSAAGQACFCAVARNAATFRRDMQLRYEVPMETQGHLRVMHVDVIGGKSRANQADNLITLPGMQPGETRWVCLTVDVLSGNEGKLLPVRFYEMAGNRPVNGFSVAALPAKLSTVARANLKFHASGFDRMFHAFKVEEAKDERAAAQELLRRERIEDKDYLEFLQGRAKTMNASLATLLREHGNADPFATRAAFNELEVAGREADPARAASTHACLLHKLDAYQSMLQKSRGDPADILHNVRWQKDLYRSVIQLRKREFADALVKQSQKFITAYEHRKTGNQDYPRLMKEQLPHFQKTAEALASERLELNRDVADIEASLDGSLETLQKSHRGYLLKLQALMQ